MNKIANRREKGDDVNYSVTVFLLHLLVLPKVLLLLSDLQTIERRNYDHREDTAAMCAIKQVNAYNPT